VCEQYTVLSTARGSQSTHQEWRRAEAISASVRIRADWSDEREIKKIQIMPGYMTIKSSLLGEILEKLSSLRMNKTIRLDRMIDWKDNSLVMH
jgi:hypothetical protein